MTGARLALGGRPILRDVDLSLAAGEVVALLGASGCGKTTLLRSIAGLQRLDAGRVLIAGQDVTPQPAQARDIGMMFQHYALFPNLSVRENIKFGMLARGQSQAAAQARADELLSMIELAPLASRLPAALSGGQRQRVALARAIATQPRLLLMDEPFSALDEHFRLPLRRQFRQLQRSLGQSCLIVTHDREEAFELADRVAVMFDGQIAQCASPRELWRAPASSRVADFLGVFNRFDATRLEGTWQRPHGHWLAPIEALQVLPAGTAWPDDSLRLTATMVAAYWGQQRVALELRATVDVLAGRSGSSGASGQSERFERSEQSEQSERSEQSRSVAASAQTAPLIAWCDHHTDLPASGSEVRLAIPAADLRWLET